MSDEMIGLIESLRLTEITGDEDLQEARALALRYLRSRSPIPQTVMTIVERGARESRSTIGESTDMVQ